MLARGPLPDDLRERIYCAADRGLTPDRIAARMNELGLISGMGGKRWSARKIRKILRERTASEERAA